MSTIGPEMPDALLVRAGLEAALVQQHDDRLHAAAAQLAGRPVGRLHLVAELDALDAGLGDQGRRGLQGHADVADLDPVDLLDGGAGQDRPAGVLCTTLAASHGKSAPGVAAFAPGLVAAVLGVAAAALHPQQLRPRPRRTRGCRRWRRRGPWRSATRPRARRGTARTGTGCRRSGRRRRRCGSSGPWRAASSRVVARYSAPPTWVPLGSRVGPSVASRAARRLQVAVEVVERQHLQRDSRGLRPGLGALGHPRRRRQGEGNGDGRESTAKAHEEVSRGAVVGWATKERRTDGPPEGELTSTRGSPQPGIPPSTGLDRGLTGDQRSRILSVLVN